MILNPKLRQRLPAWTIALLLAVAVSFWGIGYKVSLYHPAVQRTYPAAKLLSQKERPAQSEESVVAGKPIAEAIHHSVLAHAVVALTPALQITQTARCSHLDLQKCTRLLPLHSLRQSTPRPPPATA